MIPCRWSPLFTSKQRESALSYALHFLRIISHQMCCAGERAEGRTEGSLHLPRWNRRSAGSFSQGCQGQPALCFNPKLGEKGDGEENEQKSQICSSHRRRRPGRALYLQWNENIWHKLNFARLHVFLRKYVVIGFAAQVSSFFCTCAARKPGKRVMFGSAEEFFHLDQLEG